MRYAGVDDSRGAIAEAARRGYHRGPAPFATGSIDLAPVPSSSSATRYTRASELNAHAYCRRAWWLEQVQGVAPANSAALTRGAAAHTAHGRTLRSAARLRRWAVVFLVVGAVLLVAALRAQ